MENSLTPYVHVSDDNLDTAISIYDNKYMHNISKDRLSDDDCIKIDEFMEALNPYITTKRRY